MFFLHCRCVWLGLMSKRPGTITLNPLSEPSVFAPTPNTDLIGGNHSDKKAQEQHDQALNTLSFPLSLLLCCFFPISVSPPIKCHVLLFISPLSDPTSWLLCKRRGREERWREKRKRERERGHHCCWLAPLSQTPINSPSWKSGPHRFSKDDQALFLPC